MKRGGGNERRHGGGRGEAERIDRAVLETALEDREAGGVRRVGDHGQPAAGHRARDQRIFQGRSRLRPASPR